MSLMALSFGMAIAPISQFPVEAGVMTAIIGGLAGSLLSGSIVSIHGAAAALAPILAGAVVTLGLTSAGQIDYVQGYYYTLAVIFTSGILMGGLAVWKKTRLFACFFTDPVIEPTLATIALMLLASRYSVFIGAPVQGETIFAKTGNLTAQLASGQFTSKVVSITLLVFGSLLLMKYAGSLISFSFRKSEVAKKAGEAVTSFFLKFPPQLFAIPFMFVLSKWVFHLEPQYRIQLSEHFFSNLGTPATLVTAFSGLMYNSSLWMPFLKSVIKLTLVDTAETVATILGVARLDIFKRDPDPDRTVLAMGIANAGGSLFGTTSNIPGGAKSSMAARLGARTSWTGLICAICVAVEVWLFRDYINEFPLCGLAAIIVFSVMPLANPAKLVKFGRVGYDQLAVAFFTLIPNLYYNDIIYGLACGVLSQMLFILYFACRADWAANKPDTVWERCKAITHLWTKPTWEVVSSNDRCDVYLGGSWAFYKGGSLEELFNSIPPGVETHLHAGREIYVIDYPTLERLCHQAERRNIRVNICSDSLYSVARHDLSTRIRRPARMAMAYN